MIDTNGKEITAVECRHVVYCAPPEFDDRAPDIHLVKEILHYEDGTSRPNVRLISNFKRKFWITKKGFQNHKQAKEWESLDKVNMFESTQSQLRYNVAKAIGEPWFKGNMRMLQRNPYIYGTDILSTAIIKRSYQDKFPDKITKYSTAMYDVETDVLHGTEQIIIATLSYGKRVFTAIQESFLSGQTDCIPRLRKMLDKYLGEYVTKRQIQWVVIIVKDEISIVKEIFQKAHEWQPDFVAIWNINFDMPKTIRAIENAGLDTKDIFSDPCVPIQYRHFKYKQGPKQKVTASGKTTPIKPPMQWHTVYCPSSFYFIDAMCAYRHIRIANAEEQSYSLDAILQKHLGIRKLTFKEADGFEKLDYHLFMQEKYPLEYVIYNVFDCVSMEELDEETSDLALTLPLFSGCSDFENFKSQPRRLADNLHYTCLSKGKVFGSTSDQMSNDFDKMTLGLDGWIVTLPAHLVVENGLQVIKENSFLHTSIRAHVGDLDVSASYPNGGSVFNISKETTHKELCKIEGVPEIVQRYQGINLSGGQTNSVEFCTEMFGLPTLDTLLKSFQSK